MPRPDDAARLSLVEFLLRQGLSADAAEAIATSTWHLVSRHYLAARYGADWPSYKAMGRRLHTRAADLYDATLAFAWSGRRSRTPSDIEPSDWARLASLLKRVNSDIAREPVRDSLPELDDEFFTALDLVLTRVNLAKFRLSVAVAAINAVRGRPRGSEGANLARALAGLWKQFTGHKATVSSATGKATGPFVEFCELAPKLLPVTEQYLIQITPDVIAKACRRQVATK